MNQTNPLAAIQQTGSMLGASPLFSAWGLPPVQAPLTSNDPKVNPLDAMESSGEQPDTEGNSQVQALIAEIEQLTQELVQEAQSGQDTSATAQQLSQDEQQLAALVGGGGSSANAPSYAPSGGGYVPSGGGGGYVPTGGDGAPASGGGSGDSGSSAPTGNTTVGDPGAINNPTDFARAMLKSLGDPETPANIQSIVNWEAREGGNWNNTAHFNPLNTTQAEPGATSMNSVGVKSYTNWQQGLQATVSTLQNGQYGDILSALKSGGGLSNGNYHGLSTWSGGGYSHV